MTATKTTVYKIRDSKTGLYSTGGTTPKFNKSGKTWSQIGHLKCHLKLWQEQSQYPRKRQIPIPENWEVVSIQISQFATEPVTCPANEFVK